jgi:DNA-binding HxlR family transcriptional regulator
MADRRYEDPCGIARALNVVGERWALLVIRELLLGPKRFTDVRRGLPTASPNVLSQRLQELERDGVVRKRRLGPPSGAMAYELTEWGRALEPVLDSLGTWGARTPVETDADIGIDSLMLVVKSMFDPAAASELSVRCEVRLGVDRYRAMVANGRLQLARGEADRADVVVEADPDAAKQFVFGSAERRAELLASGAVRTEGDAETLARVAAAFSRGIPGT